MCSCGRDVRCTQVGQVRETRQALILRDTKAGLWSELAKKHPDLMNETSFYQILNEEMGSALADGLSCCVANSFLDAHLTRSMGCAVRLTEMIISATMEAPSTRVERISRPESGPKSTCVG